jgi:hypothetical protein
MQALTLLDIGQPALERNEPCIGKTNAERIAFFVGLNASTTRCLTRAVGNLSGFSACNAVACFVRGDPVAGWNVEAIDDRCNQFVVTQRYRSLIQCCSRNSSSPLARICPEGLCPPITNPFPDLGASTNCGSPAMSFINLSCAVSLFCICSSTHHRHKSSSSGAVIFPGQLALCKGPHFLKRPRILAQQPIFTEHSPSIEFVPFLRRPMLSLLRHLRDDTVYVSASVPLHKPCGSVPPHKPCEDHRSQIISHAPPLPVPS